MRCPWCDSPLCVSLSLPKPLVGRFFPAVYTEKGGWSLDTEMVFHGLDAVGAIDDIQVLAKLIRRAWKNDEYPAGTIPAIYDNYKHRLVPLSEEEEE